MIGVQHGANRVRGREAKVDELPNGRTSEIEAPHAAAETEFGRSPT